MSKTLPESLVDTYALQCVEVDGGSDERGLEKIIGFGRRVFYRVLEKRIGFGTNM